MPDVLIRGVPRKTLELLKKRAKRRRRSLQAELHDVIETAAEAPAIDFVSAARRFRESLRRTGKVFSDSGALQAEGRSEH